MPRLPPVTMRTRSAATEEQPVEVGQGELIPRRAPVIAASGALGRLHLAQQGVHLGARQRAVRAHRGVAGHGGEELVLARGEDCTSAEFADLAQYVARECRDIAAR